MPACELAAKALEEQGRFNAALAMFEGTPPEVTTMPCTTSMKVGYSCA